MLDIRIPKFKYNTTDYPNLESRADDMAIPERYGVKTDITPVCIDTSAMLFKLAKREIKAITEIRAGDTVLVLNDDYTVDLANAQFTLITTPLLQPNTDYYMVFEGDWVINGSDWVEFYGFEEHYADGNSYEIDGGGAWTPSTVDFVFQVFGKNTLTGTEERKVEDTDAFGAAFHASKLRDHADRTKVAMKFKTPDDGQSFYITRIYANNWKSRAAFPADKNLWMTLYSDQGVTQVGVQSRLTSCNWLSVTPNAYQYTFPQQGLEVSSLLVDIEGYKDGAALMDNVADILEDVLVNIVGVPSGDLDAAAFAALKAARTESINPQLDKEVTFDAFVAKLEAGQLFKFMPALDGTFSPKFYAAGEPGGTPHLRDQDFLWFKSKRNLASVKRNYIVKYNEHATSQIYEEKEYISTIAEYLYQNKETLQLETYLKDAADATQLTLDYAGLLEYPQREIQFEVKSYLLDKIPTDKVKITRTRGDNTNGTFDAVLFRILKLTKKQSTGTVVCMAVLDTQTY